MAWTPAEQAAADHLAAEPGPLLNAGPAGPGGEAIGDGAEQAAVVRLTFTDGTAIEDTVDNGVVLLATSPGPRSPARVQILSSAGTVLAEYDEFGNFA